MTWFTSHAPDAGVADMAGASDADISELTDAIGDGRALPKALVHLLSRCNGGMYIREYTLLSTTAIAKAIADNSSSETWDTGFVPVAMDLDENYLGVCYARSAADDGGGGGKDADEGSDSKHGGAERPYVTEWSASEGLAGRKAATFEDYLEVLRNELLSNKFEFIEDVGLVEKMASPVKAAHK